MRVLRICIPVFDGLTEVSGQKVIGPASHMFNGLLDIMAIAANFTITPAEKAGDVVDHLNSQYDGCLGMIQGNQSDLMIQLSAFPILGPGLQHSHVVTFSKTLIVSAYDSRPLTKSTDVMDAFNGLTAGVWTVSLMMTLLLSLVVTWALIVHKKHLHPDWSLGALIKSPGKQIGRLVLGHILNQYSSFPLKQEAERAARSFFLWFSVFTFFLHYCFSAMMKTEMVVQEAPRTITSYEDILNRKGVVPLWAAQMDDHWQFQRAASDSRQGRIWQRAVKAGIDRCLLSGSMGSMHMIGIQVGRQEAVYISSSLLVGRVVPAVCALSRNMDLMTWGNALITPADEDEKLLGNMHSSSIPRHLSRRVFKLTQAAFEIGLPETLFKSTVLVPATATDEYRDCVANRVIYPNHGFGAPTVHHYQHLFLVGGALMAISVTVLVVEIAMPSLSFWFQICCLLLRRCHRA